MQNLTQERLEELAHTPNVTVMKPQYDVTFDPWPDDRLQDCIKRLTRITRSSKDESDARETASKDPDLMQFAQVYQTFFKKLTSPEFVNDRRAMEAMMALVALRRRANTHEISENEANAQAVGVVMAVSEKKTDGPRAGPA